MSNEHNPVAQLVTQIQHHWQKEVANDASCRMVRWIIKPEEVKLYEGFLRIECSANGSVPDLFVVLLTPFISPETYSAELMNAWLDSYDNDMQAEGKAGTGVKAFTWQTTYFRQQALSATTTEQDLLEMMTSFYAAAGISGKNLVLALMPRTISTVKGYEQWMAKMLEAGIPEHIILSVFDDTNELYFDELFAKWRPATKTLLLNLNLKGAIKQIYQAGDLQAPEVQLRHYLLKMSEAVSAGNLKGLHLHGRECIAVMLQSAMKPLMATAHIMYAGMLFGFKEFPAIETLLKNGYNIAEKGAEEGDVSCLPLTIQFCGYLASCYQLDKQNLLAVEWFCKQAEKAIQAAMPLQAVSAYRQAVYLARKEPGKQYRPILQKAYETGIAVPGEELKLSDFNYTALEYYEMLLQNGNISSAEETDEKITAIYGPAWKEEARQRLKLVQQKAPVLVEPA